MIFRNFINGEFVNPSSEMFLKKLSPFDGAILGDVPKSSAMDFILALQGAKKAGPEMKALTLEKRALVLSKMADHLESSKVEIAFQEALHQGLPQDFVLQKAIEPAILLIRKAEADLLSFAGHPSSYQPSGVISIVCSWQLSLLLILERLVPALAAGNSVLIKISELSPVTGESLGQMLQQVDLPRGSVQILHGDAEVAQLMVSHPGVAAVTAVGRQSTLDVIAKSGLSPFKKLQLAGSAKNVCALVSGFDLETDFLKVMESFMIGQGQLCWNSSRLILLESQAETFYQKLQEFLFSLKPLANPKDKSLWTPLISQSIQEKLQVQRAGALNEKGSLLKVSKELKTPGFFAEPVFIKELTNCSVLHQDELQTPLFLVNTVKYQHEIAKWANNSYLGHSASIWGDSEKATKVGQAIEVAQVQINNWQSMGPQSVFGFKQSSFGTSDLAWNGPFYSDVKKLTSP